MDTRHTRIDITTARREGKGIESIAFTQSKVQLKKEKGIGPDSVPTWTIAFNDMLKKLTRATGNLREFFRTGYPASETAMDEKKKEKEKQTQSVSRLCDWVKRRGPRGHRNETSEIGPFDFDLD